MHDRRRDVSRLEIYEKSRNLFWSALPAASQWKKSQIHLKSQQIINIFVIEAQETWNHTPVSNDTKTFCGRQENQCREIYDKSRGLFNYEDPDVVALSNGLEIPQDEKTRL